MDTDVKIKLAEDVANQLTGVDRNEFKKWIEYLKVSGDTNKAMRLAELLSRSQMLRERPQRSYALISSLKLDNLMKAPLNERLEVLGYASRILEGMLGRPSGVLRGYRISEEEIRRAREHGRRARFRQ